MAFEQRDNSGSVFVNDRKTEDHHADRTGKAMIDGKMYFVDGFLKKTSDGKPFLALRFKAMAKVGEAGPKPEMEDLCRSSGRLVGVGLAGCCRGISRRTRQQGQHRPDRAREAAAVAPTAR